jgi:hypothetical protein
MIVNNHKSFKNGGFIPPLEQNENKLSGKMTENKGLFLGYMLDFLLYTW